MTPQKTPGRPGSTRTPKRSGVGCGEQRGATYGPIRRGLLAAG
jgi:hypothetical protein